MSMFKFLLISAIALSVLPGPTSSQAQSDFKEAQSFAAYSGTYVESLCEIQTDSGKALEALGL